MLSQPISEVNSILWTNIELELIANVGYLGRWTLYTGGYVRNLRPVAARGGMICQSQRSLSVNSS